VSYSEYESEYSGLVVQLITVEYSGGGAFGEDIQVGGELQELQVLQVSTVSTGRYSGTVSYR
jgi:hypothetical protein